MTIQDGYFAGNLALSPDQVKRLSREYAELHGWGPLRRQHGVPRVGGGRRGIVEGAVKPKPRLSFTVGEEVRVLEGAFANFTGTVDEVNADKQKLKVIVSIFGRRTTSVELDFSTVEKR